MVSHAMSLEVQMIDVSRLWRSVSKVLDIRGFETEKDVELWAVERVFAYFYGGFRGICLALGFQHYIDRKEKS